MTCLAVLLRNLRSHLLAVLLVTAVVGFQLTGCSDDDPALLPEVKPGNVDINAQNDLYKLRKDGTLHLALFGDWPKTFNPLYAESSADYLQIAKAMYPRAFVSAADGSLKVNTDYFSSVEMIREPQQLVTYTINPEAQWSDGTPITWRDIYSQVRAFSSDGYTVRSKAGFDRVASVTRGVDDRQAILRFNETTPYAEWRGMFSGYGMLLPQSITATPGTFNVQGEGPGPSAGPFIISGVNKAANKIILRRNPRWWGAPPVLASIEYSVVGSKSLDDLLENVDESPIKLDDVDAVPLTSADQAATVEQANETAKRATSSQSPFKIRRALGFDRLMIAFSGTASGHEGQELREAILMAIDREEIASFLERGLTAYPVPLDSHVFVPGQIFMPDKKECYGGHGKPVTFDLDAARRKLDKLGWRLNGAVREKNGDALIVRVVAPTVTDFELAAMLEADLARIGVQLQIDRPQDAADPDDGDSPGDAGEPPKYELAVVHLPSDAFALSTMEWAYKSDSEEGIGIGSEDIDKLIESAMTDTGDPCKANDVDQKLWEQRRSLPLVQSLDLVAVRGNVANYGAFGMEDIDYTRIGFTS